MRYIEFIIRDRSLNFTVDEVRAEKILDSNEQMIKLVENGKWTGQTINKAEIIGTRIDLEKTKDEYEKELKKSALPEPTEDNPELLKKKDELLKKFKPDFLK